MTPVAGKRLPNAKDHCPININTKAKAKKNFRGINFTFNFRVNGRFPKEPAVLKTLRRSNLLSP